MNILVLLIPITFCLGLTGLLAFLWSLRSGQYEDLSGAAERVLLEAEDAPARRAEPAPGPDANGSNANPKEARWSQT